MKVGFLIEVFLYESSGGEALSILYQYKIAYSCDQPVYFVAPYSDHNYVII